MCLSLVIVVNPSFLGMSFDTRSISTLLRLPRLVFEVIVNMVPTKFRFLSKTCCDCSARVLLTMSIDARRRLYDRALGILFHDRKVIARKMTQVEVLVKSMQDGCNHHAMRSWEETEIDITTTYHECGICGWRREYYHVRHNR